MEKRGKTKKGEARKRFRIFIGIFLDIYSGAKQDPLPKNLELKATTQEIGWLKQQQFKRDMRHAGDGKATDIELIHLAERGKYYRDTPKEYIKKPLTLWERRQKAQAGKATKEQLIKLACEGYYYPTTPMEYRRKPLPKDSD